ncbi:MAG: TrkH family potassium uptake protein [Firmicutes bacterium]|nr:TrkH family potassium uptake protein [Bacillota bacterium]
MILNKRPITKILMAVMALVGAAMLIPAVVALIYGETHVFFSFIVCSVPMIAIGLIIIKVLPPGDNTTLKMRDGFFIVAMAWTGMSVLGALPFVISGSIPHFIDAFFETASGFTTTGSTIVGNIEALPYGILFWRSFTHWLGGMGVLVLTIALLPMLGIGGAKIMRAETTGPTMDKISGTVNDSARKLYTIYFGVTIVEIIFLMCGGLNFFEASTHTFGTVGTGGLSTHSQSVAAFGSAYVEMVIAVFMLLAGVNFNLYHYLFTGKPRIMLKDPEFRTYLGIIFGSTAFISIMLLIKHFYGSIAEAFRYAFFQVVSIITTTGYGTADYDTWPIPCRILIFLLMVVGGCASSTGGGVKVIRIILTAKLIKRGAQSRLHSSAVRPIKLGGRNVDEDTLSNVKSFMIIFLMTMLIGTVIVSLDGYDIVTSLSAVVATLSNIGPGFNLIGPSCNFVLFSYPIKILLSMFMIAGRLEIYTIFIMFTRVFWKDNNR